MKSGQWTAHPLEQNRGTAGKQRDTNSNINSVL